MASVDEILDFAIAGEQEAVGFYTELAARMDLARMREVFEGFASEEQGHKAKLRAIKEGQQLLPATDRVLDLKIADYVVDVQPKENMDYQEALILAMKREKASFKLYTDLAAAAEDEDLRKTFSALAQEEAKHKLRFEVEYDDTILKGA